MPDRIFVGVLTAIGLALGLLLAPLTMMGQVGPPNQIQCNRTAQLNVAGATASGVLTLDGNSGSQQVLVGSLGQRINICGWHFTNQTSATQGTFQFVAGLSSGTTPGCTGTQVILTPAIGVTSTAPSSDHIDYASMSLAQGLQLCVTTTGAVTITGVVFISQQ